MIVTYLDSSALVRLVAREGDFSLVEQAIQSGPASSVLAELELRAAIFKRWQDGDVTEQERDALLSIADTAILPVLAFLPLDEAVLAQAQQIEAVHPVRTLDALHVATAVVANRHVRRRGSVLHFCTADRRQADAAIAVFGGEHVSFVPPWRGKHATSSP